MMNAQNRKRFLLAGLVGVMVFCAGVLVGQVDGKVPADDTVPVFAALTQGSGTDGEDAGFAETRETALEGLLPEQSATEPGEIPENWFAIEEVTAEAEATLSPEATPTAEADAPTDHPETTEPRGFQIELVREEAEDSTVGTGRSKRVLIYHTHTYEAYEQASGNPYKETQQWRTEDNSHNIVSVGEELAALLRSMGVEVVHDATAFEPPDLNTSYTRSLEMLKTRQQMGETYDLYIDLHRDAYVASQSGSNAVALGGSQVAKVMLLIGKGEGQTGEGFEEKPPWEENLAIAQQITNELNGELPGICKDVRIKSGRFNQHIGVGCVLVEVGNNRNTLQEAKAAMPYLADAVCAVLAIGK